MRKIIDEDNCEIYYYGNVEELKIQLRNFSESLGIPLNEEINEIKKITNHNKHISTLFERVYYNNSKLYYRVNSSDKNIQKKQFKIMKERAEKIDERFIEENPKYNLEFKLLKKVKPWKIFE